MKSLWQKLLWWRKKPAEDQKFIQVNRSIPVKEIGVGNRRTSNEDSLSSATLNISAKEQPDLTNGIFINTGEK